MCYSWQHEELSRVRWHIQLYRKQFLDSWIPTLDSILKSRNITLPTKVHLVRAMVFPIIMYGCESWTIEKAKHWRMDAFELWCWRRLLRVPWTARRSSQSILKSILNIHWKIWCWSSSTLATWCKELTHWKRPWCLERLKAGEGDDRDKMVGRHHRLKGQEFEQAPGVGDRQGSLACSSPWGCKESDTTEWLNWTEVNWWPINRFNW